MFCNKCGNQVESSAKFCKECGNQLIILQQNNVNQTKKNNIIFVILGIGLGLTSFVIIILAALFITNPSHNYYFNTNESKENENTKEINNIQNKSKYGTVIVHDNIYPESNIKSLSDANSLIVEDSVRQKNNCPNEIKIVENDLIKKYGITAVNLCEMDVEFAKELEKVFQKVYKEYPSVKGYITNITLANIPPSQSYIAAFMPCFKFATSNDSTSYPWVFKTQIILNTSYYLNTERLENTVIASSKSGHFPKNTTVYSPVAHELGHYLSFLAMTKKYNFESVELINNENVDDLYMIYNDFLSGDYSKIIINEAYEKYKKDTNSNISLDTWRGTISNYALAKDNNGEYIYDETIAESFHDVYLNGNNATPASKYIISVLKQKLEG